MAACADLPITLLLCLTSEGESATSGDSDVVFKTTTHLLMGPYSAVLPEINAVLVEHPQALRLLPQVQLLKSGQVLQQVGVD